MPKRGRPALGEGPGGRLVFKLELGDGLQGNGVSVLSDSVYNLPPEYHEFNQFPNQKPHGVIRSSLSETSGDKGGEKTPLLCPLSMDEFRRKLRRHFQSQVQNFRCQSTLNPERQGPFRVLIDMLWGPGPNGISSTDLGFLCNVRDGTSWQNALPVAQGSPCSLSASIFFLIGTLADAFLAKSPSRKGIIVSPATLSVCRHEILESSNDA